MSTLDALVVGAGPAGSVAALLLAQAGATVRLIDRARFPREKLCGDTLNPGTLAILDRLQLGAAVRRAGVAIEGMTVTGPGGACVSATYPGGLVGASLPRRDLDSMLLEAAVRAGARFDENTAVRGALVDGDRVRGVRVAVRSGDGTLPARMVIAADGRHSTLAFALGLAAFARAPKRWAFGAYFSGVDQMTRHGEMHVRGGGYIGLSPLPGGLTNVCVVREIDRAFRAQPLTGDRIIATATAEDAVLRPRFARARRASAVMTLGPLAVEARAAGLPGLLLAGDAAGFIDPMTGDGLRFAVRGGELAAAAALRELSSHELAHRLLAAARQREFAGKWRINRALRWLVDSRRGLQAATFVAGHWARPFEHLIGIAGDVSLTRGAAVPSAPR